MPPRLAHMYLGFFLNVKKLLQGKHPRGIFSYVIKVLVLRPGVVCLAAGQSSVDNSNLLLYSNQVFMLENTQLLTVSPKVSPIVQYNLA